MYRSEDGGETWMPSSQGIVNLGLEEIDIAPDGTTLLLASNGGIHKSLDGGRTWVRKGGGTIYPEPNQEHDDIGLAAVDAVHIHRSDPTLWFAGTGYSHFWASPVGMIYRSEDSGETWTTTSGLPTSDPNELVITGFGSAANERDVVYASTNKGLFRSGDAGRHWQRLRSGNYWYVAVDPNDSSHVLASRAYEDQGLYRSHDGGQSWMSVGAGLPDDAQPEKVRFDTARPGRIWVGIRNRTPALYRSDDDGLTWQALPNPTDFGWITFWGKIATSFAVSPDGLEIFYCNDGAVYGSSNGGTSFEYRYTREVSSGAYTNRGAKILVNFQIAADPTKPGRLYLLSADVGIHRSDDGGASWHHLAAPRTFASNSYWLVFDPDDSDVLYLAEGKRNDHAMLLLSSDAGGTWTAVDDAFPTDTVVKHLSIAPTGTVSSRTLFAAAWSRGIYRSVDSGQTWTLVLGGSGKARMTAIDPTDPDVVYAAYRGSPGGVWKSTDGGDSWTQLSPEDLKDVCWIAIDPVDPGRVWVGQRTYSFPGSRPGGVWRSDDGGETFRKVLDLADAMGDPQVPGYVKMVVVDPSNHNRVYAISKDDGTAWGIWVGQGVWVTEDAGETWRPLNEGLAHRNAQCLTIDPFDSSVLYLGTDGGGSYRYGIE